MPFVIPVQQIDKLIVPGGSMGGFSFIKGGFDWGVLLKLEEATTPIEFTWVQLDEAVAGLHRITQKGAMTLFSPESVGPLEVRAVDQIYDIRMGNIAVRLSFSQLCTLREGLEASKNWNPINWEGEQPHG